MGKHVKPIAYALLLIVAVLVPYIVPSNYYLSIVISSYIFAIAVYGLNLMEGYLGLLSLAQAGFFGLGAYTSGLLMVNLKLSFWIAMPAACLLTMVVALPVGLISFRTKGHYFVILTLCIGVIINLIIEKWDSLTGGVRGLIGIPSPSNLGPISFDTLTSQYYLILAFLIITIIVMKRVVDSLVGRTFKSICNSEDLAATLGINVMGNKLLAFAISAFFTAMAGALYASYIKFIGPDISDPNMTFQFLLYLLIGGQASIAGPLVGTLVSTGLTESLQSLQEYRMVVFGLLLIIIVKFLPWGLVGAFKQLKVKLLKRNVKPEAAVVMKVKSSKGEGYAAENKGFN